MNLANTFYIVGIICMTLYTILLIAIVVLLIYIWKKFVAIQKKIEERLDDLRTFIKHPKEAASDLGAAAASSALDKFADILRGRKTKQE